MMLGFIIMKIIIFLMLMIIGGQKVRLCSRSDITHGTITAGWAETSTGYPRGYLTGVHLFMVKQIIYFLFQKTLDIEGMIPYYRNRKLVLS